MNLLTPEELRRKVEEYFKKTPPAEVVRAAEKSTPQMDSECLGMLPEGAKTPFDFTRD